MKKGLLLSAIVVSALLVSGCASVSGYQPTVDIYGDQRSMFLAQDMKECEVIANHAAGTVKEIAMGTGVGAIVGAAGGAAIGAVVGNPLAGAALGSVAGLGTGLYSGVQADTRFKSAFRNCLQNRGHHPV